MCVCVCVCVCVSVCVCLCVCLCVLGGGGIRIVTLSRHGFYNCSDSWHLPLEFGIGYNLSSALNTRSSRNIGSRQPGDTFAPNNGTFLDYTVTLSQCDIRDMLHTRVMPRVDC